MNYLPPMLIPTQGHVARYPYVEALYADTPWGAAEAEAESVPAPPADASYDEYLQYVEQYAPTVATLIAGKPADQQYAILKARVNSLKPYKSIPVVGVLIQNRIDRYKAEMSALESQVAHLKYQRYATTALYSLAVLGGTAMVVWLGRKAIGR